MIVEHAYAERYRAWIAKARPLLEAGQWKEAFVGYPFILNNEEAPFTPLRRSLAESIIMPVTSGGQYLRDHQDPPRHDLVALRQSP